ncbi:MAG: hypothetical protein IJS26_02200 [Alphaproteobacteria bacterium]|nr:hypothetical protein [Alphaproteobacteria bacterium]
MSHQLIAFIMNFYTAVLILLIMALLPWAVAPYRGYVRFSVLIMGVVVYAVLLVGFDAAACVLAHQSGETLRTIVLFAMLGALGLMADFWVLRRFWHCELSPWKTHKMEPYEFGFLSQTEVYLLGKVHIKKRTFKVVFTTIVAEGSINETTLSEEVYEKMDIFLNKRQKQALRENRLKLPVIIQDYNHLDMFHCPTVMIIIVHKKNEST